MCGKPCCTLLLERNLHRVPYPAIDATRKFDASHFLLCTMNPRYRRRLEQSIQNAQEQVTLAKTGKSSTRIFEIRVEGAKKKLEETIIRARLKSTSVPSGKPIKSKLKKKSVQSVGRQVLGQEEHKRRHFSTRRTLVVRTVHHRRWMVRGERTGTLLRIDRALTKCTYCIGQHDMTKTKLTLCSKLSMDNRQRKRSASGPDSNKTADLLHDFASLFGCWWSYHITAIQRAL